MTDSNRWCRERKTQMAKSLRIQVYEADNDYGQPFVVVRGKGRGGVAAPDRETALNMVNSIVDSLQNEQPEPSDTEAREDVSSND